jgi:hypothetical protein
MARPWWEFVNDLGEKKEGLIRIDPLAEKEYSPFMVNRGLSKFVDCVMYANEMNMRHGLDKVLQYDYYLNGLRKKKRFGGKSEKPEKIDNIELIKTAYKYSDKKAKEAIALLTDEQIKQIREKYKLGGTK